MKKIFGLLLAFFMTSSVFSNAVASSGHPAERLIGEETTVNSTKIRVRVGKNRLSATLFDNPSTQQMMSLFPLAIRMKDLHSNEKYYDFPGTFPSQSVRPKEIKAGDIMLYGSSTLVIFYETFLTTYSYTKLGEMDHPSELKSVLGKGDIEVVFERE